MCYAEVERGAARGDNYIKPFVNMNSFFNGHLSTTVLPA